MNGSEDPKGWVGNKLSGIGEIILSFYNPKKDENLPAGLPAEGMAGR